MDTFGYLVFLISQLVIKDTHTTHIRTDGPNNNSFLRVYVCLSYLLSACFLPYFIFMGDKYILTKKISVRVIAINNVSVLFFLSNQCIQYGTVMH